MTMRAENFVLGKLLVGVQKHLPLYVARSAKVEVNIDELTNSIVMSVRTHVLGERVGIQIARSQEEVHFLCPKTWLDHWKRDRSNKWYVKLLLKRWPIQWVNHTKVVYLSVPVEQFRIFPHANYAPYFLGDEIHVLISGNMTKTWVS